MPTLLQRLLPWLQPKAPAALPTARPVMMVGTSGRPTYALGLAANSLVPRAENFSLVTQLAAGVPVIPRAIDILAGYVGCPEFECESQAVEDELNLWAEQVRVGEMQQGLGAFIRDHLGQTLLYGFGVGEAEIALARNEIPRLWSYRSPAFAFRTDPEGLLQIVQYAGAYGARSGQPTSFAGEILLNPLTTCVTTYNPQGSDPNGTSLFQTAINFAETWLEIAGAHRSTWRRNGDPSYAIHYQPPDTLNDPDGTITGTIKEAMETAWKAMMKSKVLEGKTEDFFAVGDALTISTIGADGKLIDVEMSKRAMVEEVVTASGLPGWMYGYSWSTTERLSTQQADMILARVTTLRNGVESSLRKIVDLRQRLRGDRRGLAYSLNWPDVNLQDAKESGLAALSDANAQLSRQKYAQQMWTLGIWDQEQVAEYLTGSVDVATPMQEPPALPTPPPPGEDQGARGVSPAILEAIRKESAAEYPEWTRCNGKGH